MVLIVVHSNVPSRGNSLPVIFSHQKKSPCLFPWTETWPVSALFFLDTSFVTDSPSSAEKYTLIYTFLVQNSLTKTAQALKREVKDVAVLKDGVNPKGPSLNKILHDWKTHQRKQTL